MTPCDTDTAPDVLDGPHGYMVAVRDGRTVGVAEHTGNNRWTVTQRGEAIAENIGKRRARTVLSKLR